MENSNSTSKLIGGILIGAAVGAALGILFAPAKGSETRSNIAGGAKKLVGQAEEAIDEVKSSVKKKVEAVKSN